MCRAALSCPALKPDGSSTHFQLYQPWQARVQKKGRQQGLTFRKCGGHHTILQGMGPAQHGDLLPPTCIATKHLRLLAITGAAVVTEGMKLACQVLSCCLPPAFTADPAPAAMDSSCSSISVGNLRRGGWVGAGGLYQNRRATPAGASDSKWAICSVGTKSRAAHVGGWQPNGDREESVQRDMHGQACLVGWKTV